MPSPRTAKIKSTSVIKPRRKMRGHTDWVRGVLQLHDGRRIITCSIDGSLRLWNLENGAQIGNDWRNDGGKSVWCIALSPDGKTVASGSGDGKVRLWDVKTKRVVARWTGHTDTTRSLWDVKRGDTVLGPIMTGHGYRLTAVIYSPDTTKIATGGYKSGLQIWDAKTGNLLSTIKLDSEVWSLAWTSDQKKLIAGGYTSISIFDTATWQQIAILKGHTHDVYSLSLFQNDRLLASACHNTTRLWNLDTNLPVGPPLQHQDLVESAAISADGKLLVTCCRDNNAPASVRDSHQFPIGVSDDESSATLGTHYAQQQDISLPLVMPVQNAQESSQELSAYSLQDLTDHIQGRSNHPIASGGFGDIWKCVLVKPNEVVQ